MYILHSTIERLCQSFTVLDLQHVLGGLGIEGVSQVKVTGRRRLLIVASIDLQLQFAIIPTPKKLRLPSPKLTRPAPKQKSPPFGNQSVMEGCHCKQSQ